MIQDPGYQHLRELSWRRKLTSAEEAELRAWLMAHPEAEPEWEIEAALNEALAQLPAPTGASNFTARVLEAVRLEEATATRSGRRGSWSWLRGWLPRTATAIVLLTGSLIFYHHHQQVVRREAEARRMAKSVLAVAAVPTLPNPE